MITRRTIILFTWAGYFNLCSLNPAICILQDRLKENEIKVSLKMPIHGSTCYFTDTSLLYQLAMLMEEAKSLELVSQSVKSSTKSENPHHRGNRSTAVTLTKESHDSAGSRSPSSIGSRRKAPWLCTILKFFMITWIQSLKWSSDFTAKRVFFYLDLYLSFMELAESFGYFCMLCLLQIN